MIKQTIKIGAATVASLGLFSSVAMAAPSITGTGYKSVDVIAVVNVTACKNVNKNNITVNNPSTQVSNTGSLNVSKNTTVGTVQSSASSNQNTAILGVSTTSPTTTCPTATTGSVDGSISNTGSQSVAVIGSLNLNLQDSVNVNNVTVNNSSTQVSGSGGVTVSGNTSVNSVASGPSTNTNSSTVAVSIQ